MEKRAISKYRRVSAFKARELSRLIQGKPVPEALRLLTFAPQKSAQLIQKTLVSAVANYKQAAEGEVDDATLLVKEAIIGEGPTMKRIRPKARGMAGRICKRTSHIRVTVWDGEEPDDLVADYLIPEDDDSDVTEVEADEVAESTPAAEVAEADEGADEVAESEPAEEAAASDEEADEDAEDKEEQSR